MHGTGDNQCPLILCIKVWSTHYRECGSVSRDKVYEFIKKLGKYEDSTLTTKINSIFKTAERHQCCIWWGQTPCQIWKKSRSRKMEFWTISAECPKEGTGSVHSHATMTVDSTSQTYPGRQCEQQDQNFNWELLWAKWKFCVLETD